MGPERKEQAVGSGGSSSGVWAAVSRGHSHGRGSPSAQQTQQPLGAPDPQPQQQQRQRGRARGPAKAEGAGGRRAAKDASGLQRVHGQVCPPGKPEPPEEPCAERGEQPHCREKGKAGLAVLPVNSGLRTLALRAPLLYQALHSSILAWRILWTEEPGGLQSMGLQRQT